MDNIVQCSFCGEEIQTVEIINKNKIIFLGMEDDILICEDCIKHCESILEKENSQKKAIKENNEILENVTPKSIKENLDKWVVGQEEAKITLSIALYNHYKRINQKESDVLIEKSNIILVGSTGSGKTYTVSTLAKQLNLPLIVEDVTGFSSTGYTGGDVEDILKRLLQAANGNKELAEKGIVLLDEGDKIKKSSNKESSSKDVNGEGVQQRLLKLVEGGIYDIKTKKGTVQFNTKNVLFILAGSFEGIEGIISKRLNTKTTNPAIGFTTEISNRNNKKEKKDSCLSKITHEDLKTFGMTSELMGRFPVITALEELSENTLVDILTKPENSLTKQYKELFKKDDIDLDFSKQSLVSIAKKAKKRKIGARALRSIMEETLKKPMFETPGTDIKLVKINENLKAKYYTKQDLDEQLNSETL